MTNNSVPLCTCCTPFYWLLQVQRRTFHQNNFDWVRIYLECWDDSHQKLLGPAISGEEGTFENQTRSHRAVPTEQWSPVSGRYKQPSQQKVKFIRNSSRRNHEGWNSPETALKQPWKLASPALFSSVKLQTRSPFLHQSSSALLQRSLKPRQAPNTSLKALVSLLLCPEHLGPCQITPSLTCF